MSQKEEMTDEQEAEFNAELNTHIAIKPEEPKTTRSKQRKLFNIKILQAYGKTVRQVENNMYCMPFQDLEHGTFLCRQLKLNNRAYVFVQGQGLLPGVRLDVNGKKIGNNIVQMYCIYAENWDTEPRADKIHFSAKHSYADTDADFFNPSSSPQTRKRKPTDGRRVVQTK